MSAGSGITDADFASQLIIAFSTLITVVLLMANWKRGKLGEANNLPLFHNIWTISLTSDAGVSYHKVHVAVIFDLAPVKSLFKHNF